MAIIETLKDHPQAFVSVKELAEYLNVSERHLQREIEKGALPARRFGRPLRIVISDAQAYVGSTGPTT